IRGLAELIIDELCKNVVEHSASADDAFIFGRVSKKDDDVRDVYENNAAPWETRFLRAVHGEGMTEIVLGDAGNGIVRTLAEQAAGYGKKTPKEILEWAFEPFSTRKRDSDDQTRGLWVVKNKVRDLRGMLYVRTSDNKGGGVSAWWDFLNDPLAEKPELDHDGTKFLGTQFQILLPHRTEERPRTFISCDRAAAASARKLRPIGFQIPREPPPVGASLGLRDAIGRLSPDEVLFIDMSLMNTAAWERKQLDKLGKTLFESFELLLDDVAGGLKTHFRRVWLLNPDDDTLRRLESSNWIISLWKNHGILQPVVRSDADPTRTPSISFVIHDPNLGSGKPGDTPRSREVLYDLIRNAVGPDEVTRASIPASLSVEQRNWVTLHVSMNLACVELSGDADGHIAAAFDVESLANAVIEALLPMTLRERIDQTLENQNKAERPVWFRLPSNRYCRNYIDPRILTELETPARNAMEKWLEREIVDSGAQYAISYTSLAPMLLTRASRANPSIRTGEIKHYLVEEYEDIEKKTDSQTRVAILVGVTGSSTTIERILERLQALRCEVTVICLVDTAVLSPATLPLLSSLDAKGRVHCLYRQPIRVYDKLPESAEDDPVSPIDPDTLIPLPPVSFASKLTDGEYWQILGESQGLTGQPTTYRGRDFSTLPLMRNIFRSTRSRKARATEMVLDHIAKCFEDRDAPDVICTNRETDDA
ncbi:MAG TPA: hypothetical protein VF219_10845, partial [Vicinamibacterales bacterium]